jgi:hypothetical protein
MGKRSNFERRPQDFYATPPEAVAPLLPHLPERFTYIEPFAGDGALVRALPGECVLASDILPREMGVWPCDFRDVPGQRLFADCIISNPPWRRDILHPAIEVFTRTWPTWFLLDADWMHTRQAAPYMRRCSKVVAIGRVKWIPGSKQTGKDNCCWYKFSTVEPVETVFVGRT